MRKNHPLFITLICLLSIPGFSQSITGKISGTVVDNDSEIPIPFASVALLRTENNIGTTTDENGKFVLSDIPVGRHDIQVNYLGYETLISSGVLVTSGKTQQLVLRLKESVYALDAVVVRPDQEKEKALNSMASVSAKQLSMEEANRFAGGFDDPARLVSSFAGVASNVGTNEIVVRGNSPKGILWRMEGVSIPNPNHFAEITGFGGGGITALSSQMLANSDFYTGAFPAEYGNALSGIFDLSIRNGNTDEF